MYWPDATVVAEPKYFCDKTTTEWMLVPTPDQAYPFEVSYWATPVLIDSANQTNWVSQNIPEALLYATLLEAVPYLKDDERVPVWREYYSLARGAITQEDQKLILDNSKVGGS
jgi:hypothetical protein